jgi:hypothetical protein
MAIAFGSVSNDSAADEATSNASSPHQFLRSYSPGHDARRFDDFGVSEAQQQPNWDEALYPCGTAWTP